MDSLKEYEQLAKRKVHPKVWEAVNGGCGEDRTLAECREAFKRFLLVPRALSTEPNVDISTTILGKPSSMPIMIAPASWKEVVFQDGEVLTAKAAEKSGICYACTYLSNTLLEDVALSAPKCRKWMQMYILKDRTLTWNTVKRAESMGFEALVVTSDSPDTSYSRSNRYKTSVSEYIKPLNVAKDASDSGVDFGEVVPLAVEQLKSYATWEDIRWLKTITNLPVILKGIMTPYSARKCVVAGVNGIIVSAHGGREQDGIPSTIESLPLVVDAVRQEESKMEVFVDGGFRDGIDIFKALAMGAKAAFIGRPVHWGLAVNGQEGVEDVINILSHGLTKAMINCGCNRLSDISPSHVVHQFQLRRRASEVLSKLSSQL